MRWRHHITRALLCFFLTGIVLHVFGQEPTFRNFGIADGLPSNTVYQVMQDSEGYLWFATDRGAARYDGSRMRIFNTTDGLCSNSIFSFHEDDKGRIWFLSDNRCLAWYANDSIYVHPYSNKVHSGRTRGIPISIAFGKNDTIYMGLKNQGLNYGHLRIAPSGYFDHGNEEIPGNPITWTPTTRDMEGDSIKFLTEIAKQHYEKKNGRKASFIGRTHQISDTMHFSADFGDHIEYGCWTAKGGFDYNHHCRRSNQSLQIRTVESGLFFYSRSPSGRNYGTELLIDGQLISTITKPKREEQAPSTLEVFELADDEYLINSDNLLFHVRKGVVISSRTLKTISTQSGMVDANGQVWIGHFNAGVSVLPLNQLETAPIRYFLDDQTVTSILVDHEGGYWFSTETGGVFYTANLSVQRLPVQATNSAAITGNDQQVLVYDWLDREDVTVWTFDGFQSDKKVPIPIKYVAKIAQPIPYGRDQLITNKVNLWLHDYSGAPPKNYPKGIQVRTGLFRIRNDTIFGATSRYLELYKIGRVGPIQSITIEHPTLKQPWNFRKMALQGKLVWIPTVNGLLRINTQTEEVTNVTIPIPGLRLNFKEIASNRKTVFVVHSNGSVYFGQHSKFQNLSDLFPELEGICNHVFCEDDNTAWISTQKGLCALQGAHLSPDRWRLRHYNQSHGLLNQEILGSFVRNDSVWALAPDQLFLFEKQAIPLNTITPKMVLNSISINGRDTMLAPGTALKPTENFLTFSFSGLSFKQAGNIPFRYKLEGLGEDWRYSFEPEAIYNQVQSGDYVFVAQAANNDGVWSDESLRFAFSVSPPFWTTWWFFTLCGLSIAGFTGLLFRLRIARINRENELQQLVAEAEHKALRSQMTPHFIFNSLNSIQRLVANNDRIFAIRNMTKFAKLMRMILNNSQESVITLEQEIDTLQVYLELESLRFSDKFTFEIQLEDQLDTSFIEIPPMLIQPYVENAIWHGIMNKPDKSGHVTISFRESTDMLICTIIDDGVGRAAAESIKSNYQKGHRSLGSEITEKRLELMGKGGHQVAGKLEITDLKTPTGLPAGTQVVLKIPLILELA